MRAKLRAFVLFGLTPVLLAGCGEAMGTRLQSIPFGMEAAATRGDLLYVATGDDVYVLSYPGGKLVGSLGIAGHDLCSDRNGDVFVPSSGYVIVEYTHGAMYPLQTLHGGDVPLGCAVDPQTGNLAVTQEASGAGDLAIFPHAKEPATLYRDPAIDTFGLCGYDDRGNLYVDGTGSGNYIAELPRASDTFTNYSLGEKLPAFGAVQWDGRRIALSDPATGTIYRLRFGRSSLRIGGTTRIKGWVNGYAGHWPYIQTWLANGTFIAQSSALATLGIWRYPGGGHVQEVLTPFRSGDVSIYGVTLSAAR